jgi:hypothetical protein
VPALADQLVALGRQRVGVMEVEQAAQLDEGLGVVLDPQLDLALPPLSLRRDDEQRCRLTAADVAPGSLCCLQRYQQSASEWPAGG